MDWQTDSMTRAAQWAQIGQHDTYDLTVIGGGATGLGVALDAALRGFTVLLLESHDFGGGTSSRSTKLLHGGVRYLAQGNFALVHEALAERSTVMHIAPHLAQPLPFVMPSYQWWQTPFYGAGLKLYDLLAGKSGLGATQWLSRGEVQQALPGIRALDLHGGLKYWDGQFDDARLALALAKTAQRAGAVVLNYVEPKEIKAQRSSHDQSKQFQISLEDSLGHEQATVVTRALVNASGVWVDHVRQMANGSDSVDKHRPIVCASQGVHLVVDRSFMPANHALLIPKTQDGRVLFVVPWMGALILGTTDTPRHDLPREPDAFASEIEFILREASKVLSRPVGRADIQSMWVGLRPLVAPAHGDASTKSLSREHTIITDDNGLVTVTGGKWTTYRVMAEETLAACFKAGVLAAREGESTESHLLVGGTVTQTQARPIYDPPGPHLYGSEIDGVLQCPGAQNHLGLGLTEAMVRYAARAEFAYTVEDVLARRWRALFINASCAKNMASAVASILHEETGLDPALDQFEQLCTHYLA